MTKAVGIEETKRDFLGSFCGTTEDDNVRILIRTIGLLELIEEALHELEAKLGMVDPNGKKGVKVVGKATIEKSSNSGDGNGDKEGGSGVPRRVMVPALRRIMVIMKEVLMAYLA